MCLTLTKVHEVKGFSDLKESLITLKRNCMYICNHAFFSFAVEKTSQAVFYFKTSYFCATKKK